MPDDLNGELHFFDEDCHCCQISKMDFSLILLLPSINVVNHFLRQLCFDHTFDNKCDYAKLIKTETRINY